jgi:hypothetical protein
MDTNPVENTIRPMTLNRKNALFAVHAIQLFSLKLKNEAKLMEIRNGQLTILVHPWVVSSGGAEFEWAKNGGSLWTMSLGSCHSTAGLMR